MRGSTTFTIDPRGVGNRWLGIGTTEPKTPLYYDADNDATSSGPNPVTDSGEEAPISVTANHLTITTVAIANVGDGLSAIPKMIREEAGETPITLTVKLKSKLTKDVKVNFTITDKEGEGAERDVNYTASIDELTIPKDTESATTTIYVTPVNDDAAIGNRVITVIATVEGTSAPTDITITDDDVETANIVLSADPLEIKEDAGETDVTITATLDGKVFDEDQKLVLVLDAAAAEPKRDVDFTAIIRSVTISAGAISGSTTISITPIDDGKVDADEVIIVKSITALKDENDEDVNVGALVEDVDNRAKITLKDTGVKADPEAPDDGTPKFSDDDVAASDTAIEGVAAMALEATVLPEATGDGDLTYSVSNDLPAGLSFDAATRTISGTPTAAGTTTITYTVVDGDTGEQLPAESAALTYTIEIAETPAATVAVDDVSATQTSIRENGETTVISITATLAEAAPVAETISFTIGNATDGAKPAVRDVDYTASLLGSVKIEAGDTQATSTLTLTPLNNDETDGNRSFGIHAEGSGDSDLVNITIADDETASTSISLSVSPNTVAEGAGQTFVTITATLDGMVLDADATVTVSLDPASQATRDVDYRMLFNPALTIVAGAVSGSIDGLIDPLTDDKDEDSESITLNGKIEIEGLVDGTGTLIITDVAAMVDDEERR